MNFKILLGSIILGVSSFPVFSQSVCPKEICSNVKGKEIYIPKDLQGMDLQNPDSKWSYHRMCCTDNVAVFWEKGFGNDLANSPQLEGHDMHVDLNNLTDKLEYFYTFFRDSLQFTKPGSKSDRYRIIIRWRERPTEGIMTSRLVHYGRLLIACRMKS